MSATSLAQDLNPSSSFETTPLSALAAIETFDGPVLVDLDETLYLRNSTEDFIDLARPGLAAMILMRVLETLRPWRWSGGEPTRDVWRVRMICWFFPWTLSRWRTAVAGLAGFGNQPMLIALKARKTPPVVLTVGFAPLVVPLVAALGLTGVTVIAARLNTFADRRRGKLACAREALGEATLRKALLVTDSLQDLPLLELCARPLHVVWPDARYRRALAHVYLPGLYITEVKRKGEHYIRRAILQEDFAVWVLSSVALAVSPLHHIAGLLFLLASFWTIYERGYVDNDLMGAKLEQDPKLSPAFFESPVATPVWQPWIWAAVLGGLGVWLVRWPTVPRLSDGLTWAGVLVGMYAWYSIYNVSPKPLRIWMFQVLQFARAAAFVALLPIVPIGAMAIGAHALARWMPYYLYRLRGKAWPEGTHVGLVRLQFFVLLAILLAIADGWPAVLNWTALALLAWTAFRAMHDIKTLRWVGAPVST